MCLSLGWQTDLNWVVGTAVFTGHWPRYYLCEHITSGKLGDFYKEA